MLCNRMFGSPDHYATPHWYTNTSRLPQTSSPATHLPNPSTRASFSPSLALGKSRRSSTPSWPVIGIRVLDIFPRISQQQAGPPQSNADSTLQSRPSRRRFGNCGMAHSSLLAPWKIINIIVCLGNRLIKSSGARILPATSR